MNKIQKLLQRIIGVPVRYINHEQISYFRKEKEYWQRNSIYLDNIYNKISGDVASMKFKYVRVEDDKLQTIKELNNTSLYQVLAVSPNICETPIVFWTRVVRCIIENGIAVVVPLTNSKGEIEEITRAEITHIDVNQEDVILCLKDKEFRTKVQNIWIFENPKTNLTKQLNIITNLIDNNLNVLSSKLNESASLKGFLKLNYITGDEDQKMRAKKRIEDFSEVAKESGIGYLDQGEEFQELNNQYNAVDKDQLEFLKGQIYNAFGLNDDLFTCNYTEEQYRAYLQSVIKPYIRVIKEEIHRKALSKTARTQGHNILAYIDIFDISSLKDLNDFAFKQKYMGNLNSNEVRAILGYSGYEGGEIFETNRNQVQIEEVINTNDTDTENTNTDGDE